jgi:hypothetical protein
VRGRATVITWGTPAVCATLISVQPFLAAGKPEARKLSFSWGQMLRTRPIHERSRRELMIQAWTGALAAVGCAASVALSFWQL